MPKFNSWWEQAVQNRLVAVVLAMVVLVPLAAAPADVSRHGVAALVFEGFAIVLLATLLWRTDWDLQRDKLVEFARTGANVPVMLLLGIALVSCLFSSHKAYSAQETLRLGTGVLLYLVIAYQFRRSEYLAKLVDVLVFLAIAASLLGFVQFAASSEVYAIGMFGDHQLFGSFLMLLMPIVAITAITETKTNRQLAAQIATIMTVACLLLTHTRSAWIGGGVGMAFLGLLAAYTLSRRARLGARKHEWALPVMMLVVAATFFLVISPDTGSIVQRASTLAQPSQESGMHYRQNTARGALAMLKARPLTGWGIGLYPYYQRSFTGNGRVLSGASTPHLDENAHNLYMQTAAELGLPGVLLLVGIVVTFLVSGLKRLPQMEAGVRRNLLLGSMASIVAFAVDAAGSPAWQLGQNSMFFWLILGTGVSCLRPKPKQTETVTAAMVPRRFTRPMTVMATLGLAALLPTVVLAIDASYNELLFVTISPTDARITGGTTEAYKLTATYRNSTTRQRASEDVTAQSTFTRKQGAGIMSSNSYVSNRRERDNPKITGSYTYNSVTETSTTNLFVTP